MSSHALIEAVRRNDLKVAKALIDAGHDVDVTPQWRTFCDHVLEFRVPTDFEIFPQSPSQTNQSVDVHD